MPAKVKNMVHEGLGMRDVRVVRCKRLESKTSKPGIVKVEFPSTEDKVRVLRNKKELKDSRDYSRVYIRSFLSHTDREMNFREILKGLPNGNRYRIAGNGCITEVNREEDDDQEPEREDPDDQDRQHRTEYFPSRGNRQFRPPRGRGRRGSFR